PSARGPKCPSTIENFKNLDINPKEWRDTSESWPRTQFVSLHTSGEGETRGGEKGRSGEGAMRRTGVRRAGELGERANPETVVRSRGEAPPSRVSPPRVSHFTRRPSQHRCAARSGELPTD